MILPHFERILEICRIRGWREGHKTLTVDRDGLKAILQEILRALPFDERWYIDNYPDVADGIAKGEIASARTHYMEFGFFEGRLPGLNGFDGAAYCRHYPDLAPLLAQPHGAALAQSHFIEHGYREGRETPAREIEIPPRQEATTQPLS